MLVKNIATEKNFFLWSDIFEIVSGKDFKKNPTYLPIDQIAESERGNKEYLNLSLTNALYNVMSRVAETRL
jgi:hypothetical protein